MPLLIAHTSSNEQNKFLSEILKELSEFLSKVLSCGDRRLDSNEISIRIVKSELSKNIGEIEVVILAYSYKERVEKQDEICLHIKEFLERKCDNKFSFFVWLQLSELGHSA